MRDWDGTAGYDAVYARFLLHHLSQPEALPRRMWAALAGGGVLVVEDADFDRWCCDPPNAGFEFFLDAYRRVLARRGGDHATGRKLYRWFLAAGIPHPQITLVQPVHQGEAKMLAWSTLDATADAIIADGIATRDQVTAALASLRRFTDDPGTLICGHGSSSSGPAGSKAGPARPAHHPDGKCGHADHPDLHHRRKLRPDR